MTHRVQMELGGRILSLESGRVARQADGAVWVQYADTVLLATVVSVKPKDDRGFFPLFVDFREKMYAAGKIPGSFFRREGRPTEKETLTCRLIDRPIRPLFPEGYMDEVQIMVMVLSSDQENDADVLGIIGASAALRISSIPFDLSTSAVRIGVTDDGLLLNPTFAQREESRGDIVVAGHADQITMMEAGLQEVSEEPVAEAVRMAMKEIKRISELQEELVRACGKTKQAPPEIKDDPQLRSAVERAAQDRIAAAYRIQDKQEQKAAMDLIGEEVAAMLVEDYPEREQEIKNALDEIEKHELRRMILEEGRRIDGRAVDDIRSITCEVGVLPRTHGSAIFTRGQTQSLAVTTLGTKMDEQKIETLEGQSWKNYMLHYNFPPFSVGEVKPIRGPGRREIGHGALAERAIQPVIPNDELFPYTIRIVSDILESNASSSQATVCAGILSLMDAGVPIKAPVAGVSIGLIQDGERSLLLTDMLGIEDHLGDMDFKVAGTREGITAIQMDIKLRGIDLPIIEEALRKGREARLHVLDEMDRTMSEPRAELSRFAPRILSMKVKQSQIGAVIGPGGKVIRAITESTGATVNIEDDGTVTIGSVDPEAGEKALAWVQSIVEEAEVNKTYTGTVKRVMPFGAFVEILPGKEGLVHISELEYHRVEKVEDVLNEGDEVQVKVIGIDDQGKIKLSRKALLDRPEGSGKAGGDRGGNRRTRR